MKSEAIKAELEKLGCADLDGDEAQGVFYWPSYTIDQFENIKAIRAHADWDVNGQTGTNRGHRWPLRVSIDERQNIGSLTIGLASWDFNLNGSAIKVINGAQTGELMISFIETVKSTRHREVITMAASSYLVVTDRS